MKKIKFYLTVSLFAALMVTSCSSNEEVTSATPEAKLPESAKAPEVVAFREAFVASIKAKSKLVNTTDESAKIAKVDADITQASITFLQACGVSKAELQSKQVQDPTEIRRMAIALLAKKTAIITNN